VVKLKKTEETDILDLWTKENFDKYLSIADICKLLNINRKGKGNWGIYNNLYRRLNNLLKLLERKKELRIIDRKGNYKRKVWVYRIRKEYLFLCNGFYQDRLKEIGFDK